MNEADPIIALGFPFVNHTGIERSKPIMEVDFERMQLGRFHPVALPVWGEIAAFCAAIQTRLARSLSTAEKNELAYPELSAVAADLCPSRARTG